MGSAFRIFRGDVKRLFSNVVSVIIVLGLVLLPSIFSWYNVLACWDVFGNTDNLKVAVANTDEGYLSDLVPLKVNMGDQVLSALLEDDEMEWVFTDEQDAIEGAHSGKYYAAVVIPPSFSKDMMTFYSPDVEHAKLKYYTNEKKNVVAPKLTEQGADNASNKINQIFTEKVGEIGLNVASSLIDYSDSAGVSGQLGALANNIQSMSSRMTQASQVVSAYASILESTRGVISGSADLLSKTGASAQEVVSSAQDSKQAISSLSDALSVSSDALSEALSSSAAGYEGVSGAIDTAFSSADSAATASASSLEAQADAVAAQAVQFRALAQGLSACQVPDEFQATLDSLVSQLESSADSQERLSEGMRSAAETIRTENSTAQQNHAMVADLAQQAKQSVSDLSQDYETTLKPQMEELQEYVSASSTSVLESATQLESVGNDLASSADSLDASLARAQESLNAAADDLLVSADKLSTLSTAMNEALASGDMETLKNLLKGDPTELAASLASPVAIDRVALFPADNFGSQMAPLYTMLGLWIGSLLLVVAIKVTVSPKAQSDAGYPKLRQVFMGRFMTFAAVSLVQSSLLALGNMFFLQVQVQEPLLYLLCYWVAGLVFTFIIYTLVVSFANLGKAIAVLLLIIQVSASGGSFPLPMLPDFVQNVSPFLPVTHAIDALRAAMMGLYQGDFWIQLGCLLAFTVPFILLGFVLRKPLMSFLDWYVRKAEESKLIS